MVPRGLSSSPELGFARKGLEKIKKLKKAGEIFSTLSERPLKSPEKSIIYDHQSRFANRPCLINQVIMQLEK